MPETPKGYCANVPYPVDVRAIDVDPRHWRTVMETGRTRMRPVESKPFRGLALEWRFTDDHLQTFQRWFRVNLENGKNHFRLTGVVQGNGTASFTLAFYPASFYTFEHSDNLFTVRATCEVIE
jgi:hypothetical protein